MQPIRMLAPPPVMALTSPAKSGADVFVQVGCHACHRPTMVTGASTIAALDHKVVPLFSDLLLHDMGSLADGITQGTATPREMKTAPLWGLRARTAFLHDGRAATVDSAIRQHDGEKHASARALRTPEPGIPDATAAISGIDLGSATAEAA